MNKKILILLTAALALTVFTTGCEEDADNKMSAAQKCLDDLDDTTSTDPEALACLTKINGIETPESYVIRCGIRFFVGGLKTQNIIDAFDDYEGASEANKANALMTALQQTSINEANETFLACQKSGVSSLIYIASASRVGTMVALSPGGGDLATCAATPGTCNDTDVGEAVIALSNAYCVGDAKETQVCSEVASAIEAAGGINADPAVIADFLYDFLQ
jgi:hypothetical protein